MGYIAIGAANGRPIGVGHYCALAESADVAAVGNELAAAGYPAPSGGFGMIPDPDGLELQLFKPPAGLVTAAAPSALEVADHGVLSPLGLEHVLLAVSDRERALRYYRFVYGEGLETRDAEVPERVWFNLARNTRIGLEPAARGSPPRFVRFGIKVAPFDARGGRAGFTGGRRRRARGRAVADPLPRQLRHHARGDRELGSGRPRLPLEVTRGGQHVAHAVVALVAGVLEHAGIVRPCLQVERRGPRRRPRARIDEGDLILDQILRRAREALDQAQIGRTRRACRP